MERVSFKTLRKHLRPAVEEGVFTLVPRGAIGIGRLPDRYRFQKANAKAVAQRYPFRKVILFGTEAWGARARQLFGRVAWSKLRISNKEAVYAAKILVGIEKFPTLNQQQLAEQLKINITAFKKVWGKLAR